ncbi:phage tail assembly protein [Pseudomonas mangiferae]|uniref:Phage tail assembly protein n=1 Tax=Pseudomonas mangiferae TaxID=2593654 RepID=A0A553H0L5_9PSED|nr:phage tail assembly protein [Pseudomonas mangiferae]TRX75284.1 phage tail assembly protein [Pseudomonas mangiferae]
MDTRINTPANDDNTLILDQPIARGDQLIEQLSLRKPSAGELRGIALSELLQLDVGAIIKLLPRISAPSITDHEARLMDPADLLDAGGKIATFLLKKSARAELYPTA